MKPRQRHYNSVCQGCHARAPGSGTPTLKRTASAATCRKRRTDDAVHIVMTDHKIVRQKPAGDLLAERRKSTTRRRIPIAGEVVPYYPEKPAKTPENEMYLALAQIKDRSNLQAGLPQLSALIDEASSRPSGFYSGLGEGYRSAGDLAKAISCIRRSDAPLSRFRNRVAATGERAGGVRTMAKAEAALRRARDAAAGRCHGWGMLGWALWQQDKAVEAEAALETAVKLDPDLADMRNYLGTLLMATGDAEAAEREFREAVQDQSGGSGVPCQTGVAAGVARADRRRRRITRRPPWKPTLTLAPAPFAAGSTAAGTTGDEGRYPGIGGGDPTEARFRPRTLRVGRGDSRRAGNRRRESST